jgi:uncharacterized repeat protein (TIGR03843 family)
MCPPERSQAPDRLTLLREGDVELEGRMPWSSNGTYLVQVCFGGEATRAVYKPVRGERPLWDFPPGLYRREVAAYVVSDALGWDIVPETVLRDGPLGTGSLQRFVPCDFQQHYFTLLEFPEHHEGLQTICAFDLLVNNADRKGGHCLLSEEGRLWSVDHGLCFHVDPKLRTVMWDFEGQAVPEHLVADLARFAVALPKGLDELLDGEECEALAARAAAIVRKPVFPAARTSRPYPWPLV